MFSFGRSPLSLPSSKVMMALDWVMEGWERLSFRALPEEGFKWFLEPGEVVMKGQPIGGGAFEWLHASCAGKVYSVSKEWLVLEGTPCEKGFAGNGLCSDEDLSEFLIRYGIVGMGGAGFPSARKVSEGGFKSLVVNGVACEPGSSIDQALLLNDFDRVLKGVDFLKRFFSFERVVVALKSRDLKRFSFLADHGFELVGVPNAFPSGAERLVVAQILGMPVLPKDVFPSSFGFLVHNVASLRAMGMACGELMPLIERPLTLWNGASGWARNLVLPLGVSVREILERLGVPFDKDSQSMVMGGLFMGRLVELEEVVDKRSLSLTIVPSSWLEVREKGCIRCGECFSACPLGLHPISIVEALGKGALSWAEKVHLKECFLCGLCSSVCPARIPIASLIERGMSCLK